MKDQVQQAAVRVVASELDRRAKPLEAAIQELQRRVSKVEDGGAAKADPALSLAVASLSAAEQRQSSHLAEASGRIAGIDLNQRALREEVQAIRADVTALQQQVTNLVAVLERLAASDQPH
jgi:polyhydroxyalkanoate synthesis regulator phasin